jgi:DNA ligase (NAD+)
MNKKEEIERLHSLQAEIRHHDILYGQNRPEITDTEYDTLYKELVSLEAKYPDEITPDSPTQKIIESIVSELKKVRHSEPMLSQQKATTLEEIEKWWAQISDKEDVITEYKMDGLTTVLTYDDGKLTRAVTRGNGVIGEDVTHNAMVIDNIPKKLTYHPHLEVRGEVVVPFEDFNRLNANGEYSNPRNLASGKLRQLDSSKVKGAGLMFVAFDLVTKGDIRTEHDAMTFLEAAGFTVVPWKITHGTAEADGVENPAAAESIQYYTDIRPKLPYMIDGIVFKFDSYDIQKKMGYTSKYPRWAIAYKFKSDDAITTLRSIEWQIGRSGVVTPVACFDAIEIAGVTIERATLHNSKNIEDKDIRIGDRILVARANDVIPEIIKSFPEKRNGTETVVEMPESCPDCGQPLTRKGPLLYCTNPHCGSTVIEKLAHFASRNAMNIDGLGDEMARTLHESIGIKAVEEIYDPETQEKIRALKEMDGFGEKSIESLIEAINGSKTQPLDRVLYGLSIPCVGTSAAKDLAKEFDSADGLIAACEDGIMRDRILELEGFSDITADAICGWMRNGKERLKTLKERGLTMKAEKNAVGTLFVGKTFVITGILSKPRSEIQKEIEGLGGKVSGSVSKKTSYLLLGEGEENSTKHKKALELGTKILSETEYESLKGRN